MTSMNFLSFLRGTIRYCFYAIFLLVPLIFASNTSELFELNKMWLTYGLTIIIGCAWFTKMIVEKKLAVQRTPLDIPLLLFLASQTISTIFSLDQQVSWWGYYSRFNGGLLSTITYIFLYYAFVSNLSIKHVLKSISVILFGGIIVALWGLPSHYGYDPTCLVFRGTFDTSCWTDAFKPTVRIFSTLGQPAWLAAYLVALLPLFMALAVNSTKSLWKFWIYTALTVLFLVEIIFSNTRAGFLAVGVVNVIFWGMLFLKKIFSKKEFLRYFVTFQLLIVLSFFVFGLPVEPFTKYTLPNIQNSLSSKNAIPQTPAVTPAPPSTEAKPTSQSKSPVENGITDSGNIRLYVWQGAIDAWKSNPLFGTGVETFAFAYYKFRPVGHNLTSEWDYLYNKAHNEYLNYLTTTGLFGLGTYLAFSGLFLFFILRSFVTPFVKGDFSSLFTFKNETAKHAENQRSELLVIALFAGWVSILITNFFGFSVVIINIFFFLIPVFVFILNDMLSEKTLSFTASTPSKTSQTNPYQWTAIIVLTLIAGWWIISLAQYWYADTKYALGSNLDRVGSYKEAYPLLLEAANIKPNEAVYKDELAINVAVLATALAQQKETETAAQFINNAILLNTQVVTNHPNNVVYWKNRVRLFYTLAQGDPTQQMAYYQEALKAIEKAHELAPTDAKISYNLGVLYGQTGDIQKGVEVLQQTITMKPDYRDAYFALGLFYRQLALNANNQVVNPEMNQKAIETYQFILTHIDPKDNEVIKSLEDWKQ